MRDMRATDDPTDLKRQEREAEADEAKVREHRRKELDDLRWLLGHPQGRRFVIRLFEKTHVFKSSFHTSGSWMALLEGERNVGLFLTDELLEASPDGYMKVLKEFRAKDD